MYVSASYLILSLRDGVGGIAGAHGGLDGGRRRGLRGVCGGGRGLFAGRIHRHLVDTGVPISLAGNHHRVVGI